ncbi:MAG TPA: tetratricopeptide repeat protein [Rhizomicrobium sp.]
MKIPFAAMAALACLACAPAHALSSRGMAEDCFRAAQAISSGHAAPDGVAACDAALTGEMPQTLRAGTLVNRGILDAAAGRDDKAIADFTGALALQPDLAAAYMNRGSALLRLQRYDDARTDFTRAIDLGTPNLHVAYFNRGEAEEAAGSATAAYHDYRKAQELAPDFQPAAQELARFTVTRHHVAAIL